MHQQLSAHAISLPLFAIMQQADTSETVSEAAQKLSKGIDDLHIEKHVQPVIEFDQDREILTVQPKDEFGKSICSELMERFQDPPCPDDMHEYPSNVMDGNCIWCGKPQMFS